MNDLEKISFAGQLHDIGKFFQRAVGQDSEIPSNFQELLSKDVYEKEFKYKHAVYSYIAINSIFKELLKQAFALSEDDVKEIVNLASKHHNPSNKLEKILQLADWFSSAEREKILEDEVNYLHSVFERISFEKEKDTGSKNFAYYRLRPLSLLEEDIFPQIYEGYFKGDQIKFFEKTTKKDKKDIEKELGDYKKLFDEFKKDLNKLRDFKGIQAYNFIYYLFQKYLWCVPASTYDFEKKSRHYPDISLFDHSRVLSAVASSLYDYTQKTGFSLEGKTKEVFDKLEEEDFLLLVEGDITGIQKFIYNIGKTQDIKDFSVAKALRGRSFLVALIPEIISRYILKSLGYTITNLLYSGGGKFQLLVANTEDNTKKLTEIEKKLNEYFYKEYGFEIGIVLSSTAFSGKYLTGKNNKSFSNVIEKNQIKLDEKKKRKSADLLTEDLQDGKKICLSCKTMPAQDKDLCKLCKKSSDIGGFIPKINYLVFDFNNTDISSPGMETFDLGKFGKIYLVPNKEIDRFRNFDEILKLNNTEFDRNNGFKFLGNTVPLIDENNLDFFKSLEEDEKKREKIRISHVIEFKYLAQLSKGDNKLGIFRADVDNLGLIISDGLKKKDEKESEKYTISRIATLSRMLDLFFAGYINKLAEKTSKDFLPIQINDKRLEQINSLIYVVYSGGDDLFIIAPYDVAVKFAQKVREEFYNFTCKNMNFGISGGVFISSPTLPIHLSAKYSEKLEDKSKKSYYCSKDKLFIKDSISILNKTFRWRNFEGKNSLENLISKELKNSPKRKDFLSDIGLTEKKDLFYFDKITELIDEFVEKYEKYDISRGFLYKLLELFNTYVKDRKKSGLFIYPQIYYQVARIKDENARNFLKDLLIKEGYTKNGKVLMKKEDIIKNLDLIISLVLMKTRGGK